jgi:hypothetical protein
MLGEYRYYMMTKMRRRRWMWRWMATVLLNTAYEAQQV